MSSNGLQPNHVVVSSYDITGNSRGAGILLSSTVREWRDYNNKDLLLGYKIGVVMVDNPQIPFCHVTVKVKANPLTKEELEKEKQIPIFLEKLEGRWWKDNKGEWQLSATAESFRRDNKNVSS